MAHASRYLSSISGRKDSCPQLPKTHQDSPFLKVEPSDKLWHFQASERWVNCTKTWLGSAGHGYGHTQATKLNIISKVCCLYRYFYCVGRKAIDFLKHPKFGHSTTSLYSNNFATAFLASLRRKIKSNDYTTRAKKKRNVHQKNRGKPQLDIFKFTCFYFEKPSEVGRYTSKTHAGNL